MNILPRLNLNDNPRVMDNLSLNDSYNMMLSKDGNLTTEVSLKSNYAIYNGIASYIGNDNYDILYCISCNIELVLFVQNRNNKKVIIFRYNEEYNKCYAIIDNFEWFGGTIIGDFTYNKENLIIAFSEYIDDVIGNVPLKVINLGRFPKSQDDLDFINPDDKLALYDNRLHPICPEVIIPKVETDRINGNSYKGWYYIFVRYKISNNTYTKWLNTNESIFVDEYHEENIIDYHISRYWNIEDTDRKESEEDTAAAIEIKEYISNNTDISSNSFKMTFTDLDSKYDVFQVALICLSKSYTKGFKSEDIKIYKDENNNSNINIVNFSGFNEYAVGDIIKSYYNYYNVKTLQSYNNRLYIGNYNEYEKTIDVSDISIKMDFFRKDVSYKYLDKVQENKVSISERINLPSNTRTTKDDVVYKTIKYNNENIAVITNPISFIDKDNNIETKKLDNSYLVTIGLKLYRYVWSNNQYLEFPAGKYYHTVKADYLGLLVGYEIDWVYDNYETGSGAYVIRYTGNSSYKSLCLIRGGDNPTLTEDFAPWLKFINNDNGFKRENILYSYNSDLNKFFFIAITQVSNGEITYSNYDANKKGYDKINHRSEQGVEVLIPFYEKPGNTINLIHGLFDDRFNNKWYYNYITSTIENNDAYLDDKTFLCSPHTWNMDWFKEFAKDVIINQPDTPDMPTDKEKISSSYSNKVIDSCGLSTNEYYSFYIHFVNKYGEVTKGYPISMFDIYNSTIGNSIALFDIEENESHINVINDSSYSTNYGYVDKVTNKLGLLLISLKYKYNDYLYDGYTYNDNEFYKYYFKFTISRIPEGYVGYFMSCENVDKTLLYSGLAEISGVNKISFYNDRLNFDDSIDFMFDKVIMSKCDINPPSNTSFNHIAVQNVTNYNSKTYNVIEKNVKVCDAFNNIGRSTCLVLTIDDYSLNYGSSDYIIKNCYFCCLINSDHENKYCNNNKSLIPCSQVNYSVDKPVIGNPKTVFVTNNTILYYLGNFYNTGLNIFQKPQNANRSIENVHSLVFKYKDYIPFESVCFNNKPTVVFFPFVGLNNKNKDTEQSFRTGYIVESKNTYDLFELRQITYDTQYPAVLNNYDKNIIYTDTFTKTIRRSNVIQDESSVNNWRKFEIEQYKNINENKGSIVKIFGLGYILAVHTEHSLFMFKSVDSIKSSEENKNIQLASIDIWDVNYQEFFTSKLGYGGIGKEYHSIVDTFGYIWYDKYNNKLYRIDGDNKFNVIDNTIKCYLDRIKPDDVIFANDKEYNRLIMCFYKNGTALDTISYNYNIGEFISRHKYYFTNAYNTKKNLYVLGNKHFHNFVESEYLNIDLLSCYNTNSAGAYIDIIINERYFDIKFIESIRYKLNKIINTPIDFNKRIKTKNIYYPGDYIRIYNDINDTGNIDAKTPDPDNNINKVENYNKPYWNLGNWNFSCIRNNIADYINNTLTNKEVSRFYGNYFIVRFIFNYNNNRIEFESLDYKLTDKRI